MSISEMYIKQCIQLALKGMGYVSPNPMVGCIIVKEDAIISEAYHQVHGQAHAEVNAINNLPLDYDFSNCTLYVNLEPCSHHGKTPPCSDLIVSKRFKKVVIGNLDINPLVSGKGIEKLKAAGIEVEYGVLEKECKGLNKRFFTFHEKKRPFIILKWAQTKDGYISKYPLPKSKEENWITGEESKKLVHLWRSEEQAVMIGTNTALADNPELTVRLLAGKNPVRIVIDKDLKIGQTFHVFNSESKTIVFTEKNKENSGTVFYYKIDFSKNVLEQILKQLYQLNILSVIVEGGTYLLNTFLESGFWDEARIFVNTEKQFHEGLKAPDLNFGNVVEKSGKDFLYRVYNN